MARTPKEKSPPRKNADQKSKASGVLDWSPVIIQVVVLGGFMFLLQQMYTSLGTHEATKYQFEVLEESSEEQLLRITVHKIGPSDKGKVKFLFKLLDPTDHQIISTELKRCEEECFGVLFPSRRACDDITQTAAVIPNDLSFESSEREFQFQTFPGNTLYELFFRIKTAPDRPTTGQRVFRIIDASTILEPVMTEYPTKMNLKDYLAVCRNEFSFLSLILLLSVILGVHKLRKYLSRRIK